MIEFTSEPNGAWTFLWGKFLNCRFNLKKNTTGLLKLSNSSLISFCYLYIFQKFCPFHLCCQISCHKVVSNIALFTLYNVCGNIASLVPDISNLFSLFNFDKPIKWFINFIEFYCFSFLFVYFLFHWFFFSLLFSSFYFGFFYFFLAF